jgi:hypothetical protein
MTKTSAEVCSEALEMLGVVATDEAMTSHDAVRAKAHMDDIFVMLNNTKGLAFEWTVETVPDGAFLPFARAVAGSVASAYNRSGRAAEAAAIINPRKSLYEIGIDQLCAFAAPDMNHENHIVTATYY